MTKTFLTLFSITLFSLCSSACDQKSAREQPSIETLADKVTDKIPTLAPAKNYTYLGGLIIPPELYRDTPTGKVDDLQICGYEVPATTGKEICFKYSELHGRLYDYDHVGLDIWDIKQDWYLALVQTGLQEVWLQRPQADFRAYPELVKGGLTFMGDWNYASNPTWPSEAWTAPQGEKVALDITKLPADKSPMITLIGAQIMPNKEVWYNVNIINNPCEGSNTVVIPNVWFPAYHDEGPLKIPSFWYYSKGC